MDRRASADLGGSSDYCVENGAGLKRSRFPCKQQLDMGESVLSSRENPAWKGPIVRGGNSADGFGVGRKGIRRKFRNQSVGNRGCEADDDDGIRAGKPVGSSLFSLTSLALRDRFRWWRGSENTGKAAHSLCRSEPCLFSRKIRLRSPLFPSQTDRTETASGLLAE